MRRFRLTYLFAFLLALLALYVIFVDKAPPPEGGKPVIYQVAKDEIERIEIVRDGREMSFTRDGEGLWRIDSFLGVRADDGGMNGMLGAFEKMEMERDLPGAEKDLAAYGLAEPSLSIAAQDKSKNRYPLLVGHKNPAGDSYYVKSPQRGKVFLYSSGMVEKFKRELNDYRAKKLFDFTGNDIQRLEYRRGRINVTLVREGIKWKLDGRDDFRVNQSMANQEANRLAGVYAKDFISDDPKDLAKYGLAKPQAEVWFYRDAAGEGEAERLLVGRKDEEESAYYVNVDGRPSCVLVADGTLDQSFKSQSELRDKRAFSFYLADLRQINLSMDGKEVACKREGVEWLIVEPASLTTAAAAVSAMANKLLALSFDEYVKDAPGEKDLEKYGLTDPSCSIDIITDKVRETVLFGKKKGKDAIYGRPTRQGIALYGLELYDSCLELIDLAVKSKHSSPDKDLE